MRTYKANDLLHGLVKTRFPGLYCEETIFRYLSCETLEDRHALLHSHGVNEEECLKYIVSFFRAQRLFSEVPGYPLPLDPFVARELKSKFTLFLVSHQTKETTRLYDLQAALLQPKVIYFHSFLLLQAHKHFFTFDVDHFERLPVHRFELPWDLFNYIPQSSARVEVCSFLKLHSNNNLRLCWSRALADTTLYCDENNIDIDNKVHDLLFNGTFLNLKLIDNFKKHEAYYEKKIQERKQRRERRAADKKERNKNQFLGWANPIVKSRLMSYLIPSPFLLSESDSETSESDPDEIIV